MPPPQKTVLPLPEPLKILLLEDDPADAELVQRLLKKDNPAYRYALAVDKASYLQLLGEFRPDIILSDNSLPQFSALDALQETRQRFTDIPFILVTGTVSDEFAANIIKSGADDYILKDRLTRLPAAIESALQKRRSASVIRSSEETRRLIMNASPDAIVCFDNENRMTTWNPQSEQMFGWDEPSILGSPLDTILPGLQKDKTGLLNRTIEIFAQRRNGEEFPVELSIVQISQGGQQFYCSFIRDISPRKKSEAALRALELEILNHRVQQQKKISRAIIKAQETERNHIGQELHDNVNQVLASIKMLLTITGEKFENMKGDLRYPVELIDNTIAEIRSLSSQHVTPLKNIDLRDMVREQLDKVQGQYGIPIIFIYQAGNRKMEDELKLNIYRVIQEQLNNIIKHAAARHVTVSIEGEDKIITIGINDDGKGFDLQKKRNGIGISNMINRVETFNGTLKIESSPGNGCSILIKIPY